MRSKSEWKNLLGNLDCSFIRLFVWRGFASIINDWRLAMAVVFRLKLHNCNATNYS